MALNVVSSDRLSTNVKTSNLATGLSDKVGQNKNLIINGNCMVAQRSTSAVTDDAYRTVDRYYLSYGGTDNHPTQERHALTSSDTGPWAKGFRYSYHVTNGDQSSGAGTGDKMEITYTLEAQDLANSGWDYTSTSSYITLSFWAKSSVAQNFHGYIKTVDGTAQNYPFETGSLSADTWTKITKKIPGNSNLQFDSDANAGLELHFMQFLGTDYTGSVSLNTWAAYASATRTPDQTSTWYTTDDSTFEITGLQLEVGDTATEFEHRSYADELRRCQRYYYLHCIGSDSGNGTNAAVTENATMYNNTSVFCSIPLPVAMRARPTLEDTDASNHFVVYSNGNTKTPNTFGLDAITTKNTLCINTTTGTLSGGDAAMVRTNNAAAYIAAVAEL